MSDPSRLLQSALIQALKDDAAVAAIVGVKVFEEPPVDSSGSPNFPSITLGPAQVLPERFDCVDGTEIHLQVDAWSRSKTFDEVKQTAEAVLAAIDEQPPDVEGFAIIDFQLEQLSYLRDPDGITRHAVITFRALIDAT